MSTTTRKLKGWPPGSKLLDSPTKQAAKIMHATVERFEAAAILTELLERHRVNPNDTGSLDTEQRWALHLAIGVLKAGPK